MTLDRSPAVNLARLMILATLVGIISVLSFAPYRLYWVMPLSLAILASILQREPRHPFWLGYIWGLAAYLSNFNWTYISLHEIAELPLIWSVLLTLLLPAYLALYPGLAAWLTVRLSQRCRIGKSLSWLLLFPACWTLCEWLRSWMLTGFPWGQAGYSQITESPLAGFTPVGGILLVTLLVALTAGALSLLLSRKPWQRLGLMIGLIIVWYAGGELKGIQWTQPIGKPITIALAQGNIPQVIKWSPTSLESTLELYARQVAYTRVDLMILPETALPIFMQDLPPATIQMLQDLAQRNKMALATGVPRYGNIEQSQYLNTVVALTTPGMPYYAKNHLVPFGEFIPLPWLTDWLYQLMNMPMSSFSSGGANQAPLALAGQKIAFNICYEDSFGDELIGPARQATMLANVSNLAWFGKSTAASQQLQLSQTRALETGRVMLRATNTGITAIIGPNGMVESIAAPFTRQVLIGKAQGRTGLTPYMHYGDWPVLILALVMLCLPLAGLAWRRKIA